MTPHPVQHSWLGYSAGGWQSQQGHMLGILRGEALRRRRWKNSPSGPISWLSCPLRGWIHTPRQSLPAPSLPAPTCSEHTEPSAESSSLQSPCKEQPGISCLKNRRQASTSHLLLAEVQFRVGSEGPGSVSTGASLPWPCCPGLGGAYGEVPSRDPRCKVKRSRGQRQPGSHTRLVSPSASMSCPDVGV